MAIRAPTRYRGRVCRVYDGAPSPCAGGRGVQVQKEEETERKRRAMFTASSLNEIEQLESILNSTFDNSIDLLQPSFWPENPIRI